MYIYCRVPIYELLTAATTIGTTTAGRQLLLSCFNHLIRQQLYSTECTV